MQRDLTTQTDCATDPDTNEEDAFYLYPGVVAITQDMLNKIDWSSILKPEPLPPAALKPLRPLI
jgi:hypothetical protein